MKTSHNVTQLAYCTVGVQILQLFLIIVILSACSSSSFEDPQVEISENTAQSRDSHEDNADLSSPYLSDEDGLLLAKLREIFLKHIRTSSRERSDAELLSMHAHGMKWDVLNDLPHTLNYPYTEDALPSSIESILGALTFLSDSCGIVYRDITYYHYCLKDKSTYLEKLTAHCDDNGLLQSIIKQYQQHKTITAAMKQEFLLSADDQLDFKNTNHTNFYILFHYMVDQERLTYQLLSQNNITK